jgi:serine/threonine protein phosphatase PrpC
MHEPLRISSPRAGASGDTNATTPRAHAIHVTVSAKSDRGRVRKKNEDSFLIADLARGERVTEEAIASRIEVGDKGVLLVVSDGMGGQKAGEVASALVVEGLARALEAAPTGSPPAARLKHAAAIAHMDVAAAARQGGREGMGATLTAVFVSGQSAYVAEVGDSRAYLLRGGSIRQLTRDQNVAQLLLDAGTLKPEEAKSSPMKAVLTQAMGHKSAVQVALGKLDLRDRDCLLLCSDGLTGQVSDEEIRGAVLGSKSLDAACEKLISLANERGGEDNITLVIAGVGGDLPAAAQNERVSATFETLETFDSPDRPPGSRPAPVPASVKVTR